MKATYEPFFDELLQQYRATYNQCPLLTKCGEFSGINCADRNFTECLFFQDVLRNQIVLLRQKRIQTATGSTASHYLFEWRRIHSAIWYTINEKNVNPKDGDPNTRRQYSNLINQILGGLTVYCFGDYNRENKTLTITPTTQTEA